MGWEGPYCVDADHINLTNVDRFIEHSDFFTLDVAMYIGNDAASADVAAFKKSCESLGEKVTIPGIENSSGPLGQGISMAVGAAVSLEADGKTVKEVKMDEEVACSVQNVTIGRQINEEDEVLD